MTFRGITLATVLLGAGVHAKPPEFGALFPPGGRQGTTFTVTTTVKNTPETGWWTDAPGVVFTPTDKPEQWQVTIPATTAPGLYQIARVNAEGVSNTRWFSVGRYPEILEVEPNDEDGKRQPIKDVPVCINGKLDKGNDVDGYHVQLKAGQTLVTMVEAYCLGSPVDVVAHVVNPRGERVMTASDHRNLDPFFAYTAPEDGLYTLQIAGFAHPPEANTNFTGGAAVVYRLHLTTGPFVTRFQPACASLKEPTTVTLHGYNLDPAKLAFTIEPKHVRQMGSTLWVDVPDRPVPVQAVPVTTAPAVEQEPNELPEQATAVSIGGIGAVIADAKDLDQYKIEMKKGERLQAKVWAKAIGAILDAELKIEGPDGKQIAANDDYDGQSDPLVQWTAAADGVHRIIVSDTLQQGGIGRFYVLEVSKPEPRFEVALAEAAPILLAPGATTAAKLTIKRLNGHTAPLKVRVAGLPAGVRSPEVAVAEKATETEVQLIAASNAPVSNMPLTFTVWSEPLPAEKPEGEAKPAPEVMVPASIPLRGETLRGTSLLDQTVTRWITVTAPAAP